MLSSILSFLLIGFVVVVVAGVAISIVGGLLGAAFSLAGLLLFKVAPLVLVGYVVVRFLAPKSKRISDADKRWLES